MFSESFGFGLRSNLLFFFAFVVSSSAHAADIYAEQSELIRQRGAVATLGPDLFGEQVDLSSGRLSFSQVDVALPGSSGLPVEIRRRFVSSSPYEKGAFGDWQLELPAALHGTYATATGWVVVSADPQARCSQTESPPPVNGDPTPRIRTMGK